MPDSDPHTLVSTAWLADHLSSPDVRVVDASWYLPDMDRDPRAEYETVHIPRAVFFDLDAISDSNSPYPHMLPDPESFAANMRQLGLSNTDRIVVYDGAGLFSAARAWWMLKVMGHGSVAVLDGGLPKWIVEGRPVSSPLTPITEGNFTSQLDKGLLRGVDDLRANMDSGNAQVVDARGAARFLGTEPEPRPGLRSGHIPGAVNLHYAKLFQPDGTLINGGKLREIFEEAGVNLSAPIITTCGSGVTAAILFLGLALLGHEQSSLYDGSWAEWGSRDDLPIHY